MTLAAVLLMVALAVLVVLCIFGYYGERRQRIEREKHLTRDIAAQDEIRRHRYANPFQGEHVEGAYYVELLRHVELDYGFGVHVTVAGSCFSGWLVDGNWVVRIDEPECTRNVWMKDGDIKVIRLPNEAQVAA